MREFHSSAGVALAVSLLAADMTSLRSVVNVGTSRLQSEAFEDVAAHLRAGNAAFAATYDSSSLPSGPAPSKRLAVVSCMDARLKVRLPLLWPADAAD